MTIQEATKIIYMIHAAYPQDRKATEQDLLDRIDLWSVFFADVEYNTVFKVVKAWIKVKSFLPSIDEIKAAVDIQKQLDKKIAQAGIIKPEQIPPDIEARLDSLISEIIESEIEGEKRQNAT